jgi:E3 ubiquitin-protein ligase HUWE1
LDSIVYGFAASFSTFCNAGGLDTLVNRIKVRIFLPSSPTIYHLVTVHSTNFSSSSQIEVDYCTELAASRMMDSMEDVQQSNATSSQSDEAAVDELNNNAAPHERTALLKAMFKFVLHMMESSGTADGLRNLIDSSLPHSLKLVVEQPQVFGNSVFALGKLMPFGILLHAYLCS